MHPSSAGLQGSGEPEGSMGWGQWYVVHTGSSRLILKGGFPPPPPFFFPIHSIPFFFSQMVVLPFVEFFKEICET